MSHNIRIKDESVVIDLKLVTGLLERKYYPLLKKGIEERCLSGAFELKGVSFYGFISA